MGASDVERAHRAAEAAEAAHRGRKASLLECFDPRNRTAESDWYRRDGAVGEIDHDASPVGASCIGGRKWNRDASDANKQCNCSAKRGACNRMTTGLTHGDVLRRPRASRVVALPKQLRTCGATTGWSPGGVGILAGDAASSGHITVAGQRRTCTDFPRHSETNHTQIAAESHESNPTSVFPQSRRPEKRRVGAWKGEMGLLLALGDDQS